MRRRVILIALAATTTLATSSWGQSLVKTWEIAVGERPFITSGTAVGVSPARADANRSIAFNPATGNVLITGGTGAAPTVNIVDGLTGADIGALSTSGIVGGIRALNHIAVADDGAIYATNLTNSDVSPLRIWKWDNEADTEPSQVFSDAGARLFGDFIPLSLGGSVVTRAGDSIDVRGSGASTQIILGSGFVGTSANPVAESNNRLAVLTPTDASASAFSSSLFILPNAGSNTNSADYRQGLTFGVGDVVYSKEHVDGTIRRTEFDLAAPSASASTITGSISGTMIALDYDPLFDLFATVANVSPLNEVRLLSVDGTVASVVATGTFPSTVNGTNTLQNADVSFATIGGTRYLFAVSANLGVVAFSVSPPAVPGDFNADGSLDASDIDLLFAAEQGAIPPALALYDLNADSAVDSVPNSAASDADVWVRTFKLTEYGDHNFDLLVDFADLLVLAQNYGSTSGGWALGNFDGTEGIGFGDLLLLAQNYGFGSSLVSNSDFLTDWSLARSVVPEPTILGVACASILLLRRRRA
jgi:hypothetical protein